MPSTPPLRHAPARLRGLLLLSAAAVLGCEVAVVDLGSTHADAGSPAGDAGADGSTGPVTTSDCPSVTEAQVQMLYGSPCNDSTCAEGSGPPRAVGSAAELVAVTATQWRTCSGEVPWPADVVGLEFQAGCTLFLLHDAPDGGVARGVLPEDQGTFNVIEITSGASVTRTMELYFPAFTWPVSVTSSDCPHHLRLSGPPGTVVDFVAVPASEPPLH